MTIPNHFNLGIYSMVLLTLAFLPSPYALTLMKRDLSAHIPPFARIVMVKGVLTPYTMGYDTPTVINTDGSSHTSVTIQSNSPVSLDEPEDACPPLEGEIDCGFDNPCDSMVVQFTATVPITQLEFDDTQQAFFEAAIAKRFDIETFEVDVLSVEPSIATAKFHTGTIEAVIQFTALEEIAELAVATLSTGSIVIDIMAIDMDIATANVSMFTASEMFTLDPVKHNDAPFAIPETVEADPVENEEWNNLLYT
jgi:hypothetical protein